MPVRNAQALIDNRVQALRDYHQKTGVKRAELDVSGGIDSAVMCGLLSRALGPAQVSTAFLGIDSSPQALARAQAVASSTGLRLIVDDLSEMFHQRVADMLDNLERAGYVRAEIEARMQRDPSVLGSLRSCLRAPLGRGYNRMTGGGIRHGTGNECEDRFLRFYQKGGDGEVDTNPIAMLSKGEVYQLAKALDLPSVVIDARPSPDLWADDEGHNDEDELKNSFGVAWTYSRIDQDSGAYRVLGSIERMARFLDSIDDRLFADSIDFDAFMNQSDGQSALQHAAFAGLSETEILALLASAKKIEAQTRHKANPNIPSLGNRAALLQAGILSNDLPYFASTGSM